MEINPRPFYFLLDPYALFQPQRLNCGFNGLLNADNVNLVPLLRKEVQHVLLLLLALIRVVQLLGRINADVYKRLEGVLLLLGHLILDHRDHEPGLHKSNQADHSLQDFGQIKCHEFSLSSSLSAVCTLAS